MPYPHPDDPARPQEPPFVNLDEVAKAWRLNARETAAYALGWRQAHEVDDVIPPVLVRCGRDQIGAVLSALTDAGAILSTYSSGDDESRTFNVTSR